MFKTAKEQYAALGVDAEAAIRRLQNVTVSLHCWQGDDVCGFEGGGGPDGGIAATGNYPGKARSAQELRADLDMALSLLPGKKKVSLHAIYLEGDKSLDRDRITPENFAAWADWATDKGIGLDFNPTFFAHKYSADNLTLSHPDEKIREFWIGHLKCSRRISEFFGKKTGIRSLNNIWIPDGYKDIAYDKLTPRLRLIDSLDRGTAEPLDPSCTRDAVESKLFGIGSEAYVVGSHEFYLLYCAKNKNVMLTLDSGHFHPTEVISAKISSVAAFSDELLLHVSRPVRWDSDHVVVLDDELCAIAGEIVRHDLDQRVHLALDYFDASVNRICAWVVGFRATQKALLRAMLEPVPLLKQMEHEGDFTSRLVYSEELKTLPFEAVWNEFLNRNGLESGLSWYERVKRYETEVLLNR